MKIHPFPIFNWNCYPWATTALSDCTNYLPWWIWNKKKKKKKSWCRVLPTMEMTSKALELKNISPGWSLGTTISVFYVQSKHFDKQRVYKCSTLTSFHRLLLWICCCRCTIISKLGNP